MNPRAAVLRFHGFRYQRHQLPTAITLRDRPYGTIGRGITPDRGPMTSIGDGGIS
jgi:hypothetical protein